MKLLNCFLALGLASFSSAALAERPHLVQPENLAKYWLVSSTGDPMAPASGVNLTAPTCVAVSYEIERGGGTSHIKLEKIEPKGDLAQVALSIVTNLHYTAAAPNIGKDPVYTYVVLPFNLPSLAQGPSVNAVRQKALDACKLDDFKLPADLL
jgi:hypothetical protein